MKKIVHHSIRSNKDSNIVRIVAFTGGEISEQEGPLCRAFSRAKAFFLIEQNLTLDLVILNNDYVKYQLRWTCEELFQYLLSSDIHLLPTHLCQGMLATGGTDSYNSLNILALCKIYMR